MMADVFIYYIVPAAIILNTVICIFIGFDLPKGNRDRINVENFKNACADFLNKLDVFLKEVNKCPANIIEAVSPAIDSYVKERVEYYIKEYLSQNSEETAPNISSENDTDVDYNKMFLHEPYNQFLARSGKQVVIRETYHNAISHLVDRSEGKCRSIFGFIDNVLTDHFQKHGDAVKEILTDNSGTV